MPLIPLPRLSRGVVAPSRVWCNSSKKLRGRSCKLRTCSDSQAARCSEGRALLRIDQQRARGHVDGRGHRWTLPRGRYLECRS
jgi:hypothetical protein